MMIGEGAEAKIYQATVFGKKMVVKRREEKEYRVKELDLKLRKDRTRAEARILSRLSGSGVRVPRVAAVGLFSIFMERLSGKLLKDTKMTARRAEEAGRLLVEMHKRNVAHGDFTPANLMLCGNLLYVIDFGLSEVTNSPEEKALDLLLMKRSIPNNTYKMFEGSYSRTYGDSKNILKRLKEIEQRGRYQIRALS